MEYKANDHFRIRNVCLFLIAFLPATKIFLLPSVMVQAARSDMWISAALNVLLDSLTLVAALVLWKRYEGRDYYDILSINLGKTGANVVYALYFLCFVLKSYTLISEQKLYVERTLYENTTTFFTFLPFFFFCGYLASKKLFVLGRLADIMFLITVASLVILYALSFANTDFGAVLPVGVNGIGKILSSSLRALNWFGDSVYLFFLIGRIPPEKKAFIKLLPSYFFAGLFPVICMLMFYGTFSSLAMRQEFALTEIAKYSVAINNIGRFDYIAIFGLLFTGGAAMCLPLYFATECLVKIFGFKKKVFVALGVTVLIFAMILLLKEHYAAAIGISIRYLAYFFLLMSNVMPLLSLFLKKGAKDEKQKDRN